MINIMYVSTSIKTTQKSFENYISFKKYPINMVFSEDEVDNTTLYNYITLDESENFIKIFDNYFFISSFVRSGYSTKNIERDYEKVKEDLNFTINYPTFFKHCDDIEKQAREIAESGYDYVFVRLLLEDYFFRLFLIHKIKQFNPKIKVIIGGENQQNYPDTLKYFLKYFSYDSCFYGFGEHVLDLIIEGKPLERFVENYRYSDELWESFALNISPWEIKNNMFITIYNIMCKYNCKFCSTCKKYTMSDYVPSTDKLDQIIDYMKFVSKKYNILTMKMESSLSFSNLEDVEYFFTNKPKDIYMTGTTLTPDMLLKSMDIVGETNGDFFVGIEHFSSSVLKKMRKPTSRLTNQKLILSENKLNLSFFLIYNFLNETLEDFNDLVNHIRILRSRRSNFGLVKLVYASQPHNIQNDYDEFGYSHVIPTTFKSYFNIPDDIHMYFKYRTILDPNLELLKIKQNILLDMNFRTHKHGSKA